MPRADQHVTDLLIEGDHPWTRKLVMWVDGSRYATWNEGTQTYERLVDGQPVDVGLLREMSRMTRVRS